MKQLKQFFSPKTPISRYFLFMLIHSFGTLFLPYFVAKIIDDGILKQDQSAIIRYGGWMLAVALGTGVIAVSASYFSAHLAGKFGHHLRIKLFNKIQELAISSFEKYGTPTLLARTTNDINNIQQILMMALQMILPAPLIILASIILTGSVSWRMVWIPIAAIACFSIVALFVIYQAIPLAKKRRKK